MHALVLARNDIREYDQMISLYTREAGKIAVLAKGIKKITSKNSANLEVFSVVDTEVAPGKEIDHLTKVQPVQVFKNIYVDFDKISIAGYAVALANEHILPGQRDDQLFNFLLSFLDFLNRAATVNALALATGFIFKFWHYLGFSADTPTGRFWLEGDWNKINSVHLSKEELRDAYNLAIYFAQNHAGKLLAKFIEHDRMI